MQKGADVIIVGGGVIGSATAYCLSRTGAGVALLERGEIGGQASGAAAGMLAPLSEAEGPGPFLDLALASLRLFPGLIQELEGEVGIDVEYRATGVLRVALSREEAQRLEERLPWQRGTGLRVEHLSGREARALEPRLSPRVHAASLSPDEHQVNPGRLTHALAEAARRRGAEVRAGVAVLGFLRRGDRVVGVRTREGGIEAGSVLLAAGPWTGRLAAPLGVPLPVTPVRGQMLAYRGSGFPRHIVWGAGGYLAPKPGGFLYAGATVEEVGFRSRTTIRGLAYLRRVARTLMPSLRYKEVVSMWAGLRPATPDRLPVLGRLPGWRNVYIATGHFRNGILLAPITGRLMAQLMLQEGTEIPLEPFSPERFS